MLKRIEVGLSLQFRKFGSPAFKFLCPGCLATSLTWHACSLGAHGLFASCTPAACLLPVPSTNHPQPLHRESVDHDGWEVGGGNTCGCVPKLRTSFGWRTKGVHMLFDTHPFPRTGFVPCSKRLNFPTPVCHVESAVPIEQSQRAPSKGCPARRAIEEPPVQAAFRSAVGENPNKNHRNRPKASVLRLVRLKAHRAAPTCTCASH